MKETIWKPQFKRNPANCIITVQFEREVDDDLDLLRDNFRKKIIPTNPDKDLAMALVNQLCVELQDAYDECGISGHFKVSKIRFGKVFDD